MEKPAVIVCATAYRPFIGGAEIAVEEVARRLAPVFDFTIVTARMSRSLPRKETGPDGTIIRLGWGTAFDKWMLPLLAFWKAPSLIPNMRKGRRAVLWGMDISQGSLAAFAIGLRFPHMPFVFTIQYGESEERLASGRFGLVGRAFRAMLAGACAVTAISSYLAETARAYGFPGQVAVIPNGVDRDLFRSQNVKTHGHQVVTVSRLVPKNGVDILIRAIAEVKKEIPDVRCRIIGDGPEKENLEALVSELGLKDTISFLGSIPYGELPPLLHETDVFVRTSRSEGMGNAFVEALAAGLPVVATRVGGIPDIIEDGKTGFLVPTEDSHDAAQKIIEFLRNHALGEAFVRAAQENILRFDWDGIARSYSTLFSRELSVYKRVTVATGLFPPDIGGPATYSKILADELPSQGIGVKISYFGAVRRLPRIIRHGAYFFRTLLAAAASDVIFAQDPVSVGLPAIAAARVLRKKFLLKVVGDYAWEQYVNQESPKQSNLATGQAGIRNQEYDMIEAFQNKRYDFVTEIRRSVQKFVAYHADRIIVPSRYLKGIIAGWGIAEENIEVVYNSFEALLPLPSRPDVRRSLDLSGTVVISAGRLVPWKGFSALIDAVADLKEEIPDLYLVIAGSGPDEKNLRHKIAERGIADHVRLTGAILHETLLSYFAAGDAFVLNSGYEGLSHTLLEAEACGLPVIASRIGGNPEIVTNEYGILIEYNNLGELKTALRTIIASRRPHIAPSKWPYTKDRMIRDTIRILGKL